MVDPNPMVVLLDLNMRVHDGMDVRACCKPLLPATHFLGLSGEVSTGQALDMVCAGASGVIMKSGGATQSSQMRGRRRTLAGASLHGGHHWAPLSRDHGGGESLSSRELDICPGLG